MGKVKAATSLIDMAYEAAISHRIDVQLIFTPWEICAASENYQTPN